MKRDALVVGINDYPHLTSLKYAADDAEKIAQLLESSGEFLVKRLPLIAGDGTPRVDKTPEIEKHVTVDLLKRAIAHLFNPEKNPPHTALLYFAGHGQREVLGGVSEGFLATSDANRSSIKGVSLNWLRRQLQASRVQQQIVWLDCCYSGELIELEEADPGDRGEGYDRCFIAASPTTALEGIGTGINKEHGLLTAALLQGLNPKRQLEEWISNYSLVEFLKGELQKPPIRQRFEFANSGAAINLTRRQKESEAKSVNPVLDICPYKGLEAFDFKDAEYFHGRTVLTDQLLEKVRLSNFLAVLGPSGSGKSSAVRAGLLQQLTLGQRLSGSEKWRILPVIRPSEHPLQSLAQAFVPSELPEEEAEPLRKTYEAQLRDRGAEGLRELVAEFNIPRLVLVIDQFEEAFSLCQDNTERQLFFDCLLSFVSTQNSKLKTQNSKLCLVLTMRADFLGKCAAQKNAGLAKKIQEHLVTVTPMTSEELDAAITEPAKKVGLEVERQLVTRMILDVTDSPGSLPLLQFALTELWQQWHQQWNTPGETTFSNRLSLAAYNELGGVRGTLEKRANQVFNQLSQVQQQVAKQIFIELTQLGEDTEDTRRQVQKAALVETLVSPQKSEALVEEVIQTLVAAKLIVISEEKGMVVVDIAHEALIRNWQQLREWVNTERDAIRLQRSIERAAKEWESTGKDLAFLWQGKRLEEAENYSGSIPLSSLAQQFIQASKAAQQKQNSALRQGTEARLREQTAKVQKLLPSHPLDGLVLAIQTLGLNLEHLQSEILGSVKDSLHRAMIVAREQNIWLGHDGAVTAVAISSDGKYILSGSDDKTVRLWDSSGYPIGLIFSGHEGGVTSVAIVPNSQYIVSGSRDKTVRLWDFSGHAIGQPFRGHTGIVNSVAVSPDGQYIVSGSSDKTVRLWDSKGKPIGQPFRGHTGIVNSVAVSPDGRYIVSGSSDKTVRLWDTTGNPMCQPLQGHEGSVSAVAISPDGEYIISGSRDKTVRIWDAKGNTIIKGHKNIVRSIAISSDGRHIVSGGDDQSLWLRKKNCHEIAEIFRGHEDDITSVAISLDAQYIVSGSRDKTVRLWNTKGNSIAETFEEHKDTVRSVAISSDGEIIATGSSDKTVRLWDIKGKSIGQPFRGHKGAVTSVAISRDGQCIVSGSDDKRVRLWDREGKRIGQPFFGHESIVTSVAISSDGQIIVSGSDDKTVRLWDREGNLIGQPLKGHESIVTSVAISSDGQIIVSGSDDKTVRLWDREGKLIGQPLKGHKEAVTSVAISSDGQIIASGSYDKTVRLWNIKGKPKGQPLIGHEDAVTAIAINPDGQIIVSSSNDRTVRLWDREGNPIGQPFIGHESYVYSVAFSPDGQIIVSSGADKTVRLWRGGNWETWLQVVCDRLRDHPIFKNPETEEAKQACEVCRKYVWKE